MKSEKLNLQHTNNEGILIGEKSDGKKYSVRVDRRRYFFPDEWNKFIKSFDNQKHINLYKTLLFTGSRIMETLHLKPKNFDFERDTVTFEIIKQRKAKRNFYATGKTRTFFVSVSYLKEIRKYIRENKIAANDYLFLDKSLLPENYETLSNRERHKYFSSAEVNYNLMLKRHLKKIGIPDWYNFSLHNIRKTYGNWMRSLKISDNELCYRLGHDLQTYTTHYGSSLIFTDIERRQIQSIMGDVKIL